MVIGAKKPTSPTGRGRWITVVALVVAGVGIAIWARIDGAIFDRAGVALVDIARPGLESVSAATRSGKQLFARMGNLIDYRNEVARLQRENEQLRNWKQLADSLEVENAALRKLNKVKPAPHEWSLTAQIIGGSGESFPGSLIVDAGMQSGVKDGSAVLDGSGLVGRVAGIGESASRIILLTDLNSRVPVVLQPSGAQAILAGDGSDRPRLTRLANRTSIVAGERVVTSGDGGLLPAGLPVGHVDSFRGGNIRIALTADYERLNFVQIRRPAAVPLISSPAILAPLAVANDRQCPCLPVVPVIPADIEPVPIPRASPPVRPIRQELDGIDE